MISHRRVGSTVGHNLPLDSLRGVAALAVVLHHVTGTNSFRALFPNMGLFDIALFHNARLFVDFFFVLSGVVIAMTYLGRAERGFSLRDFMVKRFARVYPLHLFMLLALLGFRLVRLSLTNLGILPAGGPENANDLYSFVINLLLLHSFGLTDDLTWNGPSWSISAEFYTYLVFALVLTLALAAGRKAMVYVAGLAISLASLALIVFVLREPNMDFHYRFGILRCTYGFFLGVLTYGFVRRLGGRSGTPGVLQDTLLWAALVGSVAIVSLAGRFPDAAGLAAPIFAFLFAALLLFPDRGLPRLLSAGWLVWLGQRSYSIYMTHLLVIMLTEYGLRVVGAGRIAILDAMLPGMPATLLSLGIIALVLVVSNWTFRHVERPGGEWSKRFLAGRAARAEIGTTARPIER